MATMVGSWVGNGVLKPWLEVMRPTSDVGEGSLEQAEFAANIQQVLDGTAPTVYGDPVEFFRRTHITTGIRNLLVATAQRVSGRGGNPILQTRTGFGGGKTHSLIAVYHLVANGRALAERARVSESGKALADLYGVLDASGLDVSHPDASGPDADGRPTARIAVLQGGWLSPNSTRVTPGGDPLNTLWGEMAWQLAGQAGYETVGNAARRRSAPAGEELDALFRTAGPSVILLDEIVNYARNDDLDSVSTFLHNLTESVLRQSSAVLVVSLPATETEAGGPRGGRALATFENILNRTQSLVQVAQTSTAEACEVVKRRLLQLEFDEDSREATCQAFHRMYQRSRESFPDEARESRYLERMRECYPFHPEVFDRLYGDWSEHHDFQRTRGTLRLLARSIRLSTADSGTSPMLIPADLQFGDPQIGNEFLRLLGEQWEGAMSEVDGEDSRPHSIDQRQARYAAVGGAAKRVSRAVFLGSSPRQGLRGSDPRRISLGVALPGQSLAVYEEALGTMQGQLYHLYRSSDSRYYFDAPENLNKLANDRAAGYSTSHIDAEITQRVKSFGPSHPSVRVIVAPESPGDIPDEDRVRLVVLAPGEPLPSRPSGENKAQDSAGTIMAVSELGVGRVWQNTLLFLACKSDGLRELREATGLFLAWDSLLRDPAVLLDSQRREECRVRQASAADSMQKALLGAYRWVMAPYQSDPLESRELHLGAWRQLTRNPNLVQNALDYFIDNDLLIAGELHPGHLLQVLREHVWNDPGRPQHITPSALWSAVNQYVYMGLRFSTRDALNRCLEEGVLSGQLAFASGFDATSGEYYDLYLQGWDGGPPAIKDDGLLVSPEAAAARLEAMRTNGTGSPRAPAADALLKGEDTLPRNAAGSKANGAPVRIVARKSIKVDGSLYDLNLLRDEIAQNLADDGAEVTIEITITGLKAEGFSRNTSTGVAQNSESLGVELEDDSIPTG